jgi:opacity protein-like surface antigen
MTNRGLILAGLAALLLGSASAQAADLGGMKGGSIKDGGYTPQMVDNGGARWYLRGDYSHAWQGLGSMTEPPNYDLSMTSIANTNAFGFGIGHYFSKNIRGDITLDWRREAAARGSVLDDKATVQGERQFGISNVVALANLYYDFDTRSHFTPYIGVGLGFARNTTKAGSVAIAYNPAYACADVTVATCSATFEGATQTNAAGALMTGFSARLHDRLHFDAGYRFLYMGGAHTGDIKTTSKVVASGVVTNGTSADPLIHDLYAHEFRVGLRWDIK